MNKNEIKLLPEVEKKFEVSKKASRVSTGGWGHVDLNTVKLPKAKELVKAGFPYLKEKKNES